MNLYFPLTSSHLLNALIFASKMNESSIILFPSDKYMELTFNNIKVIFFINDKLKTLATDNVFRNIPYLNSLFYFNLSRLSFKSSSTLFFKDTGLTKDFILSAKSIYLFHDGHPISKTILHFFREVNLLEDGLANYIYTKNNLVKGVIKKIIGREFKYSYIGASKKIKTIFLSDKKEFNELPFLIKKKCKLIEWKVNNNHKNNFLNICDILFDCSGFDDNNNELIILTQPFERDFKQYSSFDRVNFYQKLVCFFINKKCKISVKIHPSESLNDYTFSKNVNILAPSTPIELFIAKGMRFKKAIALYSTSINANSLSNLSLNILTKKDWESKINFVELLNLEELYNRMG